MTNCIRCRKEEAVKKLLCRKCWDALHPARRVLPKFPPLREIEVRVVAPTMGRPGKP